MKNYFSDLDDLEPCKGPPSFTGPILPARSRILFGLYRFRSRYCFRFYGLCFFGLCFHRLCFYDLCFYCLSFFGLCFHRLCFYKLSFCGFRSGCCRRIGRSGCLRKGRLSSSARATPAARFFLRFYFCLGFCFNFRLSFRLILRFSFRLTCLRFIGPSCAASSPVVIGTAPLVFILGRLLRGLFCRFRRSCFYN
ncbi:MAG TPA: hypothetical protein DEP00_07170 [Lachnospiraceae bacterium]|nr:hypothetical protein [Lachnospiraceae bacterium]